MNNLRFSLILIVICLCDYISSVPYGSQLQKASSASSAAATSSSADSHTGQYGNVPLRDSKVIKVSIIPTEPTTTTTNIDSLASLNQVDGGKAYGKGGQEPTTDTHYDSYGNPVTPYGDLSSAKAVANVGFDYSNAGLAAAPQLQLDLLPPLSAAGGKAAASAYGSNTAYLAEPAVGGGLLLPAGVSVLAGGPSSLGASPHSRPTGLVNSGVPSAGAKYGLGSYGGASGHQSQQGAQPTVAAYPGEKYTGGFGGASGVLGDQKLPGYAVTENQGPQTTFAAVAPTANPGFILVPVVQDTPQHATGSSHGASHSQAGAAGQHNAQPGGSYGNAQPSTVSTGSYGSYGGSANVKPTASGAPGSQAYPVQPVQSNTQSSGSSQGSTGSYGSYGGAAKPTVPSAANGNKYTGTFGGAPGVLGNQANPGFAVKPTGAAAVQPAYQNTQTSIGFQGNQQAGAAPVQPVSQQPSSGSYGSNGGGVKPTVPSAADGNKYTGTFGGASGVLGNQGNPGFAVKPTGAAAVEPNYQNTQSTPVGSYGGGQAASTGFSGIQQADVPSVQPAASQGPTGSYGSYGGAAKPTVPSAANGNKYTGTFGGASGVLGNQANPGYAVNSGAQPGPVQQNQVPSAAGGSYGGSYGGARPAATSAPVGGAPGVLGDQQNTGFAVKPTQQSYQPTQAVGSGSYGGATYGQAGATTVASQPTYRPGQSGSYGGSKPTASGAVDGQKYTGGFGGASGVLGNQPNPGFAVKPTAPAPAVQPAYSTVPAVQATQATYQQPGSDYVVGHLTNVNAPLASPPSAALLPPASAGHHGGVTADHKIVFSDEFEPTPVYSGIYPPQSGQKVSGTGSYGKKPTGTVGGAATGTSYGSASGGSYGSYGNKQAAAGGSNSGAVNPGKYTGGFGGAAGVLGEQKAPGFAVQPDGTIRDPTIAGATAVAASSGSYAATAGHSQPKSPVGAYNHGTSQDSVAAASSVSSSGGGSYGSYGSGKYTAGFGGPPGVLSPYDNVSGGKYHH